VKVLLVNGSPHSKGCTYTGLLEIQKTLKEEHVDSEIFQIGNKPISGCIACGACSKLKKCAINDTVNEFLKVAKKADGFIFGSPVHYAGATGAITSFMDRAFFTALCSNSDVFYLKPAACITSARRAGTTATFDRMNKYFSLSEMPIISSRYWNMIHGNSPEDVKKDLEGLQIMRVLARNMAWFLRCKEAAIELGIAYPKKEARERTNFIQ